VTALTEKLSKRTSYRVKPNQGKPSTTNSSRKCKYTKKISM